MKKNQCLKGTRSRILTLLSVNKTNAHIRQFQRFSIVISTLKYVDRSYRFCQLKAWRYARITRRLSKSEKISVVQWLTNDTDATHLSRDLFNSPEISRLPFQLRKKFTNHPNSKTKPSLIYDLYNHPIVTKITKGTLEAAFLCFERSASFRRRWNPMAEKYVNTESTKTNNGRLSRSSPTICI